MSNCRNQTPALSCNTNTKCERVCVEVKRIFDACIQRRSVENAQLPVSFPQTPIFPVIVESVTTSGTAVVSNLTITPVPKCKASRVRYTLTIPLLVTVSDGASNIIYGTASYTLQQDILLKVPASSSLIPVMIEATANVVGLNGSISDSVLTVTLCITLITKVYANVIMSIPTYGYPCLPPCQEYAEDLCEEIFNRPLYPNANIPFGFEDNL